MLKKKGARHHWWPKSLSTHWTNESGHIHRIDPSGKTIRSTPLALARISGGHDIVFDQPSNWEQSFEQYFDRPDGNFPKVVTWVQSIVQKHSPTSSDPNGFCEHQCSDDDLLRLFECMLSLVIRSPRFRSSAVEFAESLRGSLPAKEQKRLAAANLKNSYSSLTNDLRAEGKYVVYVSESEEFLFGDGFYTNLNVGSQNLFGARILLPMTPTIAILHARPMQYNPEPRLLSKKADPDLVALLNETVQIFAKDCLFYRSDEPKLSGRFKSGQFLRFGSHDPIDELIRSIPGVLNRADYLPV